MSTSITCVPSGILLKFSQQMDNMPRIWLCIVEKKKNISKWRKWDFEKFFFVSLPKSFLSFVRFETAMWPFLFLADGWRANTPLFHILTSEKRKKNFNHLSTPPSLPSSFLTKAPNIPYLSWSKMRQQHNNRDRIISVVLIAYGQHFKNKNKYKKNKNKKDRRRTHVPYFEAPQSSSSTFTPFFLFFFFSSFFFSPPLHERTTCWDYRDGHDRRSTRKRSRSRRIETKIEHEEEEENVKRRGSLACRPDFFSFAVGKTKKKKLKKKRRCTQN